MQDLDRDAIAISVRSSVDRRHSADAEQTVEAPSIVQRAAHPCARVSRLVLDRHLRRRGGRITPDDRAVIAGAVVTHGFDLADEASVIVRTDPRKHALRSGRPHAGLPRSEYWARIHQLIS